MGEGNHVSLHNTENHRFMLCQRLRTTTLLLIGSLLGEAVLLAFLGYDVRRFGWRLGLVQNWPALLPGIGWPILVGLIWRLRQRTISCLREDDSDC